ncbi:hypothetical protein, partial [Legionella pneumophila]|uniref:hypothetical protein n=1 Tax=Legionella pneumophila TaxID=446 RepID=UPI0019D5EF73
FSLLRPESLVWDICNSVNSIYCCEFTVPDLVIGNSEKNFSSKSAFLKNRKKLLNKIRVLNT